MPSRQCARLDYRQIFKNFLPDNGHQIQNLDLHELDNVPGDTPGDSLLDEVIKNCLNLKSLCISSPNIRYRNSLSQAAKLISLKLSRCSFWELNLSKMTELQNLDLSWCCKLKYLHLSQGNKLQSLRFEQCTKLKTLDLKWATNLRSLILLGCYKLAVHNFNPTTKLQDFLLGGIDKLPGTPQFLNFLKERMESIDSKVALKWCKLVHRYFDKDFNDQHLLMQYVIEIRNRKNLDIHFKDPANPYNVRHYPKL